VVSRLVTLTDAIEVSLKGYKAYVNQLVETIARYGNYKVIPSSQFHRGYL